MQLNPSPIRFCAKDAHPAVHLGHRDTLPSPRQGTSRPVCLRKRMKLRGVDQRRSFTEEKHKPGRGPIGAECSRHPQA